jgi:hypothetical protein
MVITWFLIKRRESFTFTCQDSSVGIATGYRLDDQRGREFESR